MFFFKFLILTFFLIYQT